jgi:hypothetical protein
MFKRIFLPGLLLMLAACNLSGADNATPTVSGVVTSTPAQNDLPQIGVVGLEPSGAGECVLTANEDAVVFDEANPSAQPMAILPATYSAITFEQDASGWYAINFAVEDEQMVGWVNNALISTAGTCEVIAPPEVCSVRPTFVVNVYAEPSRDAEIIDALGDDYRAALVGTSEDGWYEVDLGDGTTGWIAPDEAELVGC